MVNFMYVCLHKLPRCWDMLALLSLGPSSLHRVHWETFNDDLNVIDTCKSSRVYCVGQNAKFSKSLVSEKSLINSVII